MMFFDIWALSEGKPTLGLPRQTFQSKDSEDRDSDSEARDSENGQIQGPLHSDTPLS